jgi:RluA family pseudouridine synthase
MICRRRGDIKPLPKVGPQTFLIAENAAFAAFHKPPGMETVSEGGGPELLALAREMLGDKGLCPVHRLDRDTSGVQVFARNPEAEKELVRLFRERLVEKTYLAFCLGVPRNQSGTVNRSLSGWSGGRRPVRVMKNGGLAASTHYETLASSGELAGGWRLSFLSFRPRQGRTHQIRVHAAAIGHPVLGDDQYGERRFNKLARETLGLSRQALHAWRLAFEWRGSRVEAVSPLPPDMASAGKRAGLESYLGNLYNGSRP